VLALPFYEGRAECTTTNDKVLYADIKGDRKNNKERKKENTENPDTSEQIAGLRFLSRQPPTPFL
jgi:hypothetical protein